MNLIFSLICLMIAIKHCENNRNIDEFIDDILASKKFSKVVDIIAEKTIVKLRSMKNNKLSNLSDKNETDRKLRRHITAIDKNSLRNITLKYKELINQLSRENIVLRASSKELNYQTNEVSTTLGYILGKAAKSNDSNFELSKSHENIFQKHLKKDLSSSELTKSKETRKEKLQKQFSDDIFNMKKQRDLNRKNTGRKEGDKIFMFQSSSDYDEYHEKVEAILKHEESQ